MELVGGRLKMLDDLAANNVVVFGFEDSSVVMKYRIV